MYQRKKQSFQFLLEAIVLFGVQMANLLNVFSVISVKVKEGLLQNTLVHFLSYEHSNNEVLKDNTNLDIYCDLHDFANLMHSSTKILTKYVNTKICDIYQCFACREMYPISDLHACVSQSPSEKYEEHFDSAFY